MTNIKKIKLFRIALRITYPLGLLTMYPLSLLKKKHNSNLFFFLDRYTIGGAQRVHLDILKCVQEISKQVYFTRHSDDAALKKEFFSIPNTYSNDIHFWCDNILFRVLSVHYYAFYLNRHSRATIFSSNSTFFFDLLPFLNTKFKTIELLHNFSFGKKGMEFFGLANAQYLHYRSTVDAVTRQSILSQYVQSKVDVNTDSILLIEPGVSIPPPPQKPFTLPLSVLYAGRGGVQKRIHLINQICERCIAEQLPVSFQFAGPAIDELSDVVKSKATLHGQVSDPQIMYKIYAANHIILMTSAYEGFPMLIKEAMANGCVPLVTALEGNKTHLVSGANCLLIDAVEDEQMVVTLAMEQLKKLLGDLPLLQQLSANAYTYAKQHFGKDKFNQAYRNLLLGLEKTAEIKADL